MTIKLMIPLGQKYGKDFMNTHPKDIMLHDALMLHDMEMFLEYWHSTLQVVVEAYEGNNLFDEAVEALLDMPIRRKLKRFRDSSFHFRENFHDPNAFSLFNTEGAHEWINGLQLAMHNHLYSEFIKLDRHLGRTPRTFDELMEEASKLPQKTLEALYRKPNIRRNVLCPCGSGLRYKKCHGYA